MENESSSKFMSTLAEFMHFLCTKYVDFDQSVVVSGQLSMDVDARGSAQFVVNEKLCTSDTRLIFFSNSYTLQPTESQASNDIVKLAGKSKKSKRVSKGNKRSNRSKLKSNLPPDKYDPSCETLLQSPRGTQIDTECISDYITPQCPGDHVAETSQIADMDETFQNAALGVKQEPFNSHQFGSSISGKSFFFHFEERY